MQRRRLPLAGPRRALGEDPDYRFSLANERTFLAWIRTALALVAGGLAATQFLPSLAVPGGREVIAVALVGLGTLLAGAAFRRWVTNEEAMRENRPIPTSWLPGVLAVGVGLVAVGALVLLLVGGAVG
jgi:putative membrane protein